MRLGSVEGDSAELLYTILAGTRLDDGGLVLADGSRQQLRFYDAVGAPAQAVGREGSGPGESGFLVWVDLCGDSLYAFDGANRRLSVFDQTGRYARSFTPLLGASSRPPMELRCRDEGKLVVKNWPEWEGAPLPGAFRTTSVIGVLGAAGETIAIVDSVPSDERYRYARSIGPRPLGKSTSFATTERSIFIGTGDAPEILAYSPDGILERVISWPVAEQTITASDIEKYEEATLAGLTDEEQRRSYANRIREMGFPNRFPAHGELRSDNAGNLWVEKYLRPGETRAEWLVFDGAGIWQRSVAVPEGLSIFEIGSDYILGSRTDQLGVEYVELFSLQKPLPSS